MVMDVRWQQRYENFERAYRFLNKSVQLEQYDELQAAGLVQPFEFTFELYHRRAETSNVNHAKAPAIGRSQRGPYYEY